MINSLKSKCYYKKPIKFLKIITKWINTNQRIFQILFKNHTINKGFWIYVHTLNPKTTQNFYLPIE